MIDLYQSLNKELFKVLVDSKFFESKDHVSYKSWVLQTEYHVSYKVFNNCLRREYIFTI